VLTDDRGQAVIVDTRSWDGSIAYMLCKVCGHRFKLPVEEV